MAFILVPIQVGQHEALILKLEEIRKSGQYIFPGSVARYIVENETVPGQIQVVLVWRGIVMPDEAAREEAIEALKQELAGVLDWDNAQYNYGKILMHT